MTLPAPVIDTFSVSLTATSACDAPVDEISAVLVWSDAASNLLAPVMSVTSSSTLPSIIIFAPAVGFDFGKIAYRSSVSRDVTVAHNAAPAAAGSDQNQPGQESDRNLIHNSTLADETTSAACLDSRICRY